MSNVARSEVGQPGPPAPSESHAVISVKGKASTRPSTTSTVRRSSTLSGSTARRVGTSGGGAATNKPPPSSTARTTVNLNKAPIRGSTGAPALTATTKRPTTTTTTTTATTTGGAAHRSQLSIGSNASLSEARRSAAAANPSSPGKSTRPASSNTVAAASRKSNVMAGASATRPNSTKTASGSVSTTATRTATKPAVSGAAGAVGIVVAAKQRLSVAPTLVPSDPPKHATGESVTSGGTSTRTAVESSKEQQELMEKLASREAEIEVLKCEIASSQAKLVGLTEGPGSVRTEARAEASDKEELENLKAQYADEIESSNRRLLDFQEQLIAAEAELDAGKSKLADASTFKKQAESDIASFKQELYDLEAQYQARLDTCQENLARTTQVHSSELKQLQDELTEQHRVSAQALEARQAEELKNGNIIPMELHQNEIKKLNANHADALAGLQKQLDEQAVSEVELRGKLQAGLEAKDEEISQLKQGLAHLKSTLEATEKDAESAKADLDATLAAMAHVKASAAEMATKFAESSATLENLQSLLENADQEIKAKDETITKLKEDANAMASQHQKQLEQITNNYETEIESLKGDAFNKRRFLDLEIQHDELLKSHTKAIQSHKKTLDSIRAEQDAALQAQEAKETDHQQALDALRASHVEELRAAKAGSEHDSEARLEELETVKASHAKQIGLLKAENEADLADKLGALIASHENALETLKRESEAGMSQELARVRASHRGALQALREESAAEKKSILAAHDSAYDALKKDSEAQVESLVARHSEEVESIRALGEGAQTAPVEKMRKDLESKYSEELSRMKAELDATELLREKLASTQARLTAVEAAQSSALDALRKDLDRSHSGEIEKLLNMHNQAQETWRKDAAAELEALRRQQAQASEQWKTQHEATLTKFKADAEKLQNEVDFISQQLAHEKMARFTAEAELDAMRNSRSETADGDLLCAKTDQLAALREAHVKELATIRKTTAEAMDELATARKELETVKLEAEAHMKTSKADYNDMNEALTQLVEDAEAKATKFQKEVIEANGKISELTGQLKIREAELVESRPKVETARDRLGNRFAKSARVGDQDMEADEVEGEPESDHSSVALASLAKGQLHVQQIMDLEDGMRAGNLRMLKAITDTNSSLSMPAQVYQPPGS